MGQTAIEWTATYNADGTITPGHSINPLKFRISLAGGGEKLVNMCTKCSPGCVNCYAETITGRFWPKEAGEFPGYTAKAMKLGEFVIDHTKLQEVLRRRKPTKFFWCDMTDLFHEKVPFELVDQCFAVMALTPQHIHMILTKRPERMAEYLQPARSQLEYSRSRIIGAQCEEFIGDWRPGEIDQTHYKFGSRSCRWPLPNVWKGTSVENQDAAHERIPHLLRCPAAVRFLSCEPLLGPVDLMATWGKLDGDTLVAAHAVDWVIVGGESGPGARRCNINWMRSIVQQCKAAGVPVFVKQLGARPTCTDGEDVETYVDGKPTGEYLNVAQAFGGVTDRKGGDITEFPEDLRIREFPTTKAGVA